MGLFKKIKLSKPESLARLALAPATGGASMVSDAKGMAGVALAPVTGGASMALLQKDKKSSGSNLEELETENRRLTKELSLAQRKQKTSGIASLIGSSDTLG